MHNISILLALLLTASSDAFQDSSKNLGRREKIGKNKTPITLESCGIAKNTFKDGDRIVGGRDALYGEFPWQVSLQYKSFFISPTHICGAAVLNEKWIITAAHCVHGRLNTNFEVAVGMYKLDDKENYVTSFEVAEIIEHKGFLRETFQNDIALLKLKQSINFTKSNGYVNGICLVGRNQTPTDFAIATGWGNTMEGGDGSNVLQAVSLPIVPRSTCEAIFGKDAIFPEMLCAGEPEGGVDTCQGDSGGPLIQKDSNGKSVLIGIVSWGVGCARPGFPGIYTSVSYFIDWITANIN